MTHDRAYSVVENRRHFTRGEQNLDFSAKVEGPRRPQRATRGPREAQQDVLGRPLAQRESQETGKCWVRHPGSLRLAMAALGCTGRRTPSPQTVLLGFTVCPTGSIGAHMLPY